ncbi:hypothetical protein HNR20_004937 [Micromonospora parathelypteridis]|uniref:Uncharacterized protein n=1 Tax=Micromonospora parathelypteridis TaxID=1839617 RepID=A0A840VTD4_9ACTN|nr:hypothetical protein [Micromonospora parathelypteridis]
MTEAGDGPRLAHGPFTQLSAFVVTQAGRRHQLLDGHVTLQHLVTGLPHPAHATLTERTDQPIAIGNQLSRGVKHARKVPGEVYGPNFSGQPEKRQLDMSQARSIADRSFISTQLHKWRDTLSPNAMLPTRISAICYEYRMNSNSASTRATRALVLASAFMVAVLTACTPASDARQPGTPPVDSATSSAREGGAALPCTPSVTAMPTIPAGYRLVGKDVAVPDRAVLPVEDSGEADRAARLFAKWGLVVRAGAVVDLQVAPGSEGVARIGWGALSPPATAVTVHACSPEGAQAQWRAFVGGTWVAQAACVPLVVRSNGQEDHVTLGIGVACDKPNTP